MFPDDTRDRSELFRAVLAEFLAMAMFVFMGCGSVVATGEFLVGSGVSVAVARVMPIATSFGISIVVLAFSIGPISGGHINPAVTFALMLQRKISPCRTILYMMGQFLGSVLGAALLWGGTSSASYKPIVGQAGQLGLNLTSFVVGQDVVPTVGRPPFNLGANGVNPTISTSNALLLEIMGTSLLIGTVLTTAVDNRSLTTIAQLAPIPIGFSVWVAHLVLIPWTGCGINPARTFGPAIVDSFAGVNTWGEGHLVVYFLGPFLGSFFTTIVTFLLWGGMTAPSHRRVIDNGGDDGTVGDEMVV